MVTEKTYLVSSFCINKQSFLYIVYLYNSYIGIYSKTKYMARGEHCIAYAFCLINVQAYELC